MDTDEIARLRRENLHLRCVMAEAAHEILAFIDFHVSEGGRGPHLLLDRLMGRDVISDEVNPYPARVSEVQRDR